LAYQLPLKNFRLLTELDSDCSGCSTGNNCRTFYSPAPLGVFTTHKMTAAATTSADFTGSSNFDSFAQTLVGLLFWHLIGSLNIKGIIYSIRGLRSIPQPGKSQKKEKLVYSSHQVQPGGFYQISLFLLTLPTL
jgi:hypothetical protein